MSKLLAILPLDAGITLMALTFNLGIAGILLIAVIFIEARVMRKHFPAFSYSLCLKHSFIMNIASTIAGIPLLYFVGNSLFNPDALTPDAIIYKMGGSIVYLSLTPVKYMMIQWMLLAFVISVIVECLVMLKIVRPRPTIGEAVSYSLLANLLSYFLLMLIP